VLGQQTGYLFSPTHAPLSLLRRACSHGFPGGAACPSRALPRQCSSVTRSGARPSSGRSSPAQAWPPASLPSPAVLFLGTARPPAPLPSSAALFNGTSATSGGSQWISSSWPSLAISQAATAPQGHPSSSTANFPPDGELWMAEFVDGNNDTWVPMS
jgi:hypothetical protein